MIIKHSLITLSLMVAMTVAATTGAVADDRLDDIMESNTLRVPSLIV